MVGKLALKWIFIGSITIMNAFPEDACFKRECCKLVCCEERCFRCLSEQSCKMLSQQNGVDVAKFSK